MTWTAKSRALLVGRYLATLGPFASNEAIMEAVNKKNPAPEFDGDDDEYPSEYVTAWLRDIGCYRHLSEGVVTSGVGNAVHECGGSFLYDEHCEHLDEKFTNRHGYLGADLMFNGIHCIIEQLGSPLCPSCKDPSDEMLLDCFPICDACRDAASTICKARRCLVAAFGRYSNSEWWAPPPPPAPLLSLAYIEAAEKPDEDGRAHMMAGYEPSYKLHDFGIPRTTLRSWAKSGLIRSDKFLPIWGNKYGPFYYNLRDVRRQVLLTRRKVYEDVRLLVLRDEAAALEKQIRLCVAAASPKKKGTTCHANEVSRHRRNAAISRRPADRNSRGKNQQRLGASKGAGRQSNA